MQPLEGARVLVLSADPFAVEPLMAGLEEDGADVIFRVSTNLLPEPDELDAVVVDDSARAASPGVVDRYLDALPERVLILESLDEAREKLRDRFVAPAPAAPAGTLRQRLDTRLTRAALTVLVVTALLWLIRRAQLTGREDLPPVTPGDPQAAGQSQLAGRVTRTGAGEGLAGAAVVASGPSGSMTTVTDGQGRWRFTDLRGGRYVVMSTAPRYVAKQQQVDVPEGRAVENVNFSLDPEAP